MSRAAAPRFRPASRGEWFDVARASPQATFFHTPYWSDVALSAHPGGADATLAAELADGELVIFPLFKPDAGALWPTLFSTFAGCYGGPIARRALTAAELQGLHAGLAHARLGSLIVTLGPLSRMEAAVAGFATEDDFTQVIDLAGRSFDDILQSLDKRRRWTYRRGLREGITVRSDSDRATADSYVELGGEAHERWGEAASSDYPPEVFRQLSAIAEAEPGAVRLWWTELSGEPAAAMWTMYWNGHVVLWHAATRTLRGTSFSPLLSMCAEVIRDAIEQGHAQVDFNPSAGHQTAVEFKRRLGAAERPVLRLHHTGAGGNPARRAAARLRSMVQSRRTG